VLSPAPEQFERLGCSNTALVHHFSVSASHKEIASQSQSLASRTTHADASRNGGLVMVVITYLSRKTVASGNTIKHELCHPCCLESI